MINKINAISTGQALPLHGQVIFPRAFAVAIDDMGWNEGGSLGDSGGPSRSGFRRNFDVRDYKCIVEVGKAVGVRFQGLFLLAEMDRQNVCANYPTTTQYGAKFDNAKNVDDSQLEVMKYIKDNAAYLEFGLHGVGHEHWNEGIRTRAEWYDLENDKPWPEQDSRDHIRCFKTIMAQYDWTEENGQSFPESYVPCAYGYYWNPAGKFSTGKLMHENGVKYINTLFEQITELNPPIEFGGGFDQGVHVINRYNYGNQWFEAASLPKEPLENYKTDIIETHWANWLATDDFLQPDLNSQWIAYFNEIQNHPDHYLAKNTEQLHSQWLYKHYTTVEEIEPGKVKINNKKMPAEVYSNDLLGNMVLAVPLEENYHVSYARLNGTPISACFRDGLFAYIYLPVLEQKEYDFEYKTGRTMMPIFVNNSGTYNVYTVKENQNRLLVRLKMYGTQTVIIKCPEPERIETSNPHLKIQSWDYNSISGFLDITISGRDMQGESGDLKVIYK